MRSRSLWSTAQAIPTVYDDGPTAIAPRVHHIPTITRRQERHDLAIATIRGALEVLDLHPEQRDRIMADIEATAAEVGP